MSKLWMRGDTRGDNDTGATDANVFSRAPGRQGRLRTDSPVVGKPGYGYQKVVGHLGSQHSHMAYPKLWFLEKVQKRG